MTAPPRRSTDEASTRAEAYGGQALLSAESERERKREEQLAAWRTSLIDGPVLIVDLNAVSSGTFDPGRVFPFDETRTVYTTRGLFGYRGVLTVSDGAILEDDTGQTRVRLAERRGARHARGAGLDSRVERRLDDRRGGETRRLLRAPGRLSG